MLTVVDTALFAAQSAVGALAGEEPVKPSTEPPWEGPANIDEATADFANRLALLAALTPLKSGALVKAGGNILAAALQSRGSIERKTLRQWMALPIQLPLSFGTLLTQSSFRALHGVYVVGLEKLPDLFFYAAELFRDAEIFVTLQYNEYLALLQNRIAETPNDAGTRIELAQTYMKLGCYPEAAREMTEAAKDRDFRAAALQGSLIANFLAANFSQAVSDGIASLTLEPSNNRTRFWLWQTAQKLDGYPPEVPPHLRMEMKVGYDPSQVQFEDVASQIGLDKTSGGRGTAVFDMDGDGYLDVILSSAMAGCSVYHNNGDGTFRDVTVGSGLEDCVNTFCITVGDYNNDGWDDFYVTRLGFYAGESALYRNNGDGTFTDVTKQAGVQNWGPGFTAEWVDYDCDGNLDLFVSNNAGKFFDRRTPNRLFHNNGDGTFTEVTREAGMRTPAPTIGCAWGDYNNDGYPDLFLSNGLARPQLFRNNGDGTFTDVSREAGVDEPGIGFVATWCDYDDDGWLDLVQFIWSWEDDMLHNLIHGAPPANGHSLRIYHNNGDGTFTLRSKELGVDGCWGTMSGNFGDFNNDGYLDLLLGNGGPRMDRIEPSVILENDGNGKFHNVTFAAGLPFTGKGHGANMADLAGDGRLCLIMASGGFYPADLLTASVFRPKSLPGNYLNVRLVGTRSNRNAIGARLKLNAAGRSQHRLVSGGSGFGCLPYEQHFGLGKTDRVDSLEIVWPGCLKQQIQDLPINNTVRIVEGVAGWEEVYKKRSSAAPLGCELLK